MQATARANEVVQKLQHSHPEIYKLIHHHLPIPTVYCGQGPIRLVVLGQDPTINDSARLDTVSTVLNLNKAGSLRSYIKQLCAILELDISQHLYATNLFKPFFVSPPVQLAKQVEFDLFAALRPIWLPLLQEELAAFPDVPVLSLGEPLLRVLAGDGMSQFVRHYWGYKPDWKDGFSQSFAYLAPEENQLSRRLYPFPHVTSARTKPFYSGQLSAYTRFLGETSGLL